MSKQILTLGSCVRAIKPNKAWIITGITKDAFLVTFPNQETIVCFASDLELMPEDD